jgi:hypothetical protein
MPLKIKTNICPGELSKFLISHRELKRGGCSLLGEEGQILRQGRICPSWECCPTSIAPRLDSKKSKGKILGIKVLGSYLGIVSCEFKFS